MNTVFKEAIRRLIPRSVRNYLRAPSATLRWWLNERRAPVDYPVRADWKLLCPINAITQAYHLQQDDPSQVQELDDFIGLIRTLPEVRLLDVGCHYGMMSFAAVHYGGATAHALAVDPSLVAGKMVARIAQLNGVQSQVRFHRAAVGATSGELEMVDAGIASAGYMVLPGDQPAQDRQRIPQTTLDELVTFMGAAPTVIKVDVESYELEVLRGGAQTLPAHSIPLCLEFHNAMMRARNVDPAQVTALLGAYGYQHYRCAGQPWSPEDVLQPEIVRVIVTKT